MIPLLIENSKNHLSIIKIKSPFEGTELFDFIFISIDNILKILNLTDPTKKTSGAIPRKIVKVANKQICKGLAKFFNEFLKKKITK